ncbi:LITAF-like zinc ribbon domain-containing protein [Saccharicrinis sp. FJH54]|uniref:LITAF-like zinc ribbon domain-containing protein n=1 Tax=Saccharicrinis sp. FJH54 TaxID=3344665 RepID=UPI0035D3FAA0
MNTMEIKCPYCEYEGAPIVEEKLKVEAWIVFGILFFVCTPLCWIPFVSSGFKEQVVRCPNCGFYMGSR